MKAELAPLSSKYYGTVIVLTDTGSSDSESIRVWVMGDYEPSEREYDFKGEDGKFYVRDDFGETYEYEICDSHYESRLSLEIARMIIAAINASVVS